MIPKYFLFKNRKSTIEYVALPSYTTWNMRLSVCWWPRKECRKIKSGNILKSIEKFKHIFVLGSRWWRNDSLPYPLILNYITFLYIFFETFAWQLFSYYKFFLIRFSSLICVWTSEIVPILFFHYISFSEMVIACFLRKIWELYVLLNDSWLFFENLILKRIFSLIL